MKPGIYVFRIWTARKNESWTAILGIWSKVDSGGTVLQHQTRLFSWNTNSSVTLQMQSSDNCLLIGMYPFAHPDCLIPTVMMVGRVHREKVLWHISMHDMDTDRQFTSCFPSLPMEWFCEFDSLCTRSHNFMNLALIPSPTRLFSLLWNLAERWWLGDNIIPGYVSFKFLFDFTWNQKVWKTTTSRALA